MCGATSESTRNMRIWWRSNGIGRRYVSLPFWRPLWRAVWRNGNIYYQFDVQGYPPVLRQTRERETRAAFTINFLDKDGFRLFEHELALAETTKAIGADDQPVGVSWK